MYEMLGAIYQGGSEIMNDVLGIDIDILMLFILGSICIGMYLNLMVFDRMATLTQEVHDTAMTVREMLNDVIRVHAVSSEDFGPSVDGEEQPTILFEDGWPKS
jgi:hypothetical protein